MSPTPDLEAINEQFRCFDLHVATDLLKGRGVYSKRVFDPGDTLFHGKAFSSINTANSWTEHCMVCLVPQDAQHRLSVCQACGLVAYCSAECKHLDSAQHGRECRAIRRMSEAINNTRHAHNEEHVCFHRLILAARILLASHEYNEQVQQGIEFRCPRTLADSGAITSSVLPMESSPRDLRSMSHNRDLIVSASQQAGARLLFAIDEERLILPDLLHRRYLADPTAASEVVHCLQQMQSNCFAMVDCQQTAVAEVCDPAAALMNHSCEPNAMIIWNCPGLPGEHLGYTIKCARHLNPGDEVLLSYVDTSTPWWERQKVLQAAHGFTCGCTLCAGIQEYKEQCVNNYSARLPVPRGLQDSIDSVADPLGRVMCGVVMCNDSLRSLLQLELHVDVAPMDFEEMQVLMHATDTLSRLTGSSARSLSLRQACQKLEQLRAPVQTMLLLLGQRNAELKHLWKVMLLAEVCKDWGMCIYLAPVVLRVFGSGLSCFRANALALAAKAASTQSLMQLRQTPDFLTKLDGAILTCEEAQTSIWQLYGHYAERLPRSRGLKDILSKLKLANAQGYRCPLALQMSEMD